MQILDQFPRLSAYDPGAQGEGGLDPLGLGAVADRIADVMVPGIRARMSQPRFTTVSAIGAIAYQGLHDLTADGGKTTVDIAFEWLVVEAMVRYPGNGRIEGLPGNQKAAQAKIKNERLSRGNYLNGPRVFGFTGVYRPFSRDAGVLTPDDRPDEHAARLVRAWEHDVDFPGYVDGLHGTRGAQLRRDIAEACQRSLEKGECSAPQNGQLLRSLSELLAPREAKAKERGVLRELIATGRHEVRNELAALLISNLPAEGISQRDLAQQLLQRAPSLGASTARALRAGFDYEEAATAIDNVFRRFLAFTTQQHGSAIDPTTALRTPGLAELAASIGDRVKRAIDAVADLGDNGLTQDVAYGLERFVDIFTADALLDALILRHEEVQANKKKLSWLDRIGKDWTVRIPYRNQNGDLSDAIWTHPMRLVTLAHFLRETRQA